MSRDFKFRTNADFKCSEEGHRYGWLREPTDIEKRLPLALWRRKFRTTRAPMRR
jgi:hypothetical protein